MHDHASPFGGDFGRPVLRVEDPPLLRGEAVFVDDIDLPGTAHVAFLRSPSPHARIEGLDLSRALAMEGVIAAFTGRDVHAECRLLHVNLTTPGALTPDRPLVATDVARYVGEPIAIVVAKDRYTAEDGAGEIELDLADLPAAVDPEAAMLDGAPRIHEGVPGNTYFHLHREWGDVKAAFDAADEVVEADIVHPRVAGSPLECRGILAQPSGDGVTVWTSTQVPHLVSRAASECLGIPQEKIRVITPAVGGGFGTKAHVYPEEIVLPWLALKLGRPVKWIEDRAEHLVGSSHARDQHMHLRAAVRRDGKVLGLEVRLVSDIGAFGIKPHGPLLDPMTTAGLVTGPYDIRDYAYDTYAVATNKSPMGPFRGVGMLTAALAHERMMDMVARRLGLDPADVRRRNLIPASSMPYTTVTGHPYESGDFSAALEAALSAVGYETLKEECRAARASGRAVGVGISSYVEFTGGGSSTFVGRGMVDIPGVDAARVWLAEDGLVHVQTTCPACGQGNATTMGQVVASALGVDRAQVLVANTDTAAVSWGTGTFMSRSSVTGATAAYRAAAQLKEAILAAAAWRADVPPERLKIVADRVVAEDGRELVKIADLAGTGTPPESGVRLDFEVTYDPAQASHPYATHVCVAEVDRETGGVSLVKYLVAEDSGRIINPLIADGQVVGGVAQGIGGALYEHVRYSEDGQMLTVSFMDYLLPTALESPGVDIVHLETPSTNHELGTKGIGEGGTIGSPGAVVNAVCDALGTDLNHLPLTPELLRRVATGRE